MGPQEGRLNPRNRAALRVRHTHAQRGTGAGPGALRIRNLHPRRRLPALAALLRGARGAAFALAALALGVPGEAEAQDVLFVSNLNQGQDSNSSDTRDRAQRFTTGSNPAGYTLTSVEIKSEDAESDDATVSICTVDESGYPTPSCTPLTAPSSFAAGIVVFSAPNDHSLGANTSYTLVIGSPGEQTLRLDATRSADQDSAETRREAGLPDPAAAAFEVRLTGPDHPVLVAVEPVSSPASVDDGVTPAQSVYGEEETVEIALRFDEPVTVTGAPPLALSIGTETGTAT